MTFTDPARQEIWTFIRALNDAWTVGDPDDLARFFHRDMVALTATDRRRREGRADCLAGWKGFREAARILRWEEIDPDIRVFGDAAVVTYDFAIAFAMGADTIETGGRDMFFLVREDGRWWVVGDHFSAHPH